jgi:hypothetical protein
MLKLMTNKSFRTALIAITTTSTSVFFAGIICMEPVKAATLVPGDSFYTDRTSFRANTSGLQSINSINFRGLAELLGLLGAPNSFIPLAPTTINGVTFTGTGLSLAFTNGGAMMFPTSSDFFGDYLASRGASLGGDKSISVLLPEGITAVGAFLAARQANRPSPFSTNFTISLVDGSSQIVSGSDAFVGFTSSSSIGSVTFSMPGDNPIFNVLALPSFEFGYAKAVPEPFTIIGTLIGGMAALRMRKKLKATKD